MRRRVLIASSTYDEHTHGLVREHLLRSGHEVVVYAIDDVMSGGQLLSIEVIDGQIAVTCDGTPVGPSDVDAAWLWKVGNFANADAAVNLSKQLTMVNEITQYNNSIWALYPEAAWLSPPLAIHRAERKLVQLQAASRVGFSVPETLITSDWGAVAAMQEQHGELVVKMFRGVIADQNEFRAMYTTPLRGAEIESLRHTTFSFPGIFQPRLQKAREWRVTAVGDEVFPAAIYTTPDASDDWRRLQETGSVTFRRDELPGDVSELCLGYLSEMRLGLGSFDLVESDEGKFTFLECNPNGQFGFLEEMLGLPIAASVADQLVRIADEGRSQRSHRVV